MQRQMALFLLTVFMLPACDRVDKSGGNDSSADKGFNSDTDTGSDTKTDGEGDTESGSETDSGSDTDTGSDTKTDDEGDTESDSETDSDTAQMCFSGGKWYALGDSFPEEGGCNTCHCELDETGQPHMPCTDMECPPNCSELGEEECDANPLCVSRTGSPVDVDAKCYGEAVFTHCMSADIDCGDAEVWTTDPQSNCWWFPDTCIPTAPGWNEGGSDMGNDCDYDVSAMSSWGRCSSSPK